MPSWKKMAAAFGRATQDPAATKKGRNMIYESNTVKHRQGDVMPSPFDTPEQRSFKGGIYQGSEAYELTHDARVIPDEAKRIYDNYDFDFERAYGPDDAYRRAVKLSGVEDAPSSPVEFEERFGFDITGPMPKHKPGYRKAWENEAAGYSDASLESDFDNEFEQAYKSALDRHDRQTARNIIKDDKDLASHGVSEDDVHKTIQTNRKLDGGFDSDDDIRAQMIEELKSGVDLSDFFEKYR